jgi:hypothetical protein
MPDGMEFVFKNGINKAHQTATPEFIMEQYYKVPEKLRAMGQKRIAVVDRYNPSDAYWRKHYKGFTHSYMTGGDDITIWRYDRNHDANYFVDSLSHEIGHKIDTALGKNGARYSTMLDWKLAMSNDLLATGKKSITTYGENSEMEDFAESIKEYVKNPGGFLKAMPNRGTIIEGIINGKGASP